MSVESNKAAFLRIWDAVWHQPAATRQIMAQSYTNDFVQHISSLPQPIPRSQFIEFVIGWQKAFPDGRMDIEDLVAAGDRVWCYWTSHGTHSDTYLGIPATGKQVTYQGVDIWRFTNEGKVAEAWAVPDALQLLRQLGAIAK
jgi:steroid delta-isomerase-like uncharacterized protein